MPAGLEDVATPAPTAMPSPTPGPPRVQDAAYRMVIEKIGVDAPVAVYGLADGVPVVPTDANSSDPAGTVAWYDFSEQPGRGSNAVFSGHVTWNGRAVFWSLDELQPGDTIKLRAADGTELVYAVAETKMVDPNDPASLQVMKGTPTDAITLITCDGTWVPDPNDHVAGGDYTNRRVVRASLLSITGVAGTQAANSGG
jgi:LPXTG-site transpeptidase (sortase) family protein